MEVTTRTISVPACTVPVTVECDVAVVGGGVAGIAAALSAARAGARTLLLEQQFALGGLATLGLVTIYLPLCDGRGHQVSFGIAEELMRLSVKHGAEVEIPAVWREATIQPTKSDPRYRCQFNASSFAILAENLLLESGVQIRYGAQVCGVQKTNDRISALLMQSRSGLEAIAAGSVVDASGDGVVCTLSGAKTAVFQQKNILASWYYALQEGKLSLHQLGACDIPDKYKLRGVLDDQRKRYIGLDCEELTEFMIDAHRTLMEDFLRQGPISPEHRLAAIAAIPQVRMTRRIVGITELSEPDGPRHYPDSIGLIGNWKRPGPVYELPLSCLYGREVANLITAGRCISTQDDMWDNTRVIPACAVTGEAAGLAAALSNNFAQINIAELQQCLKARKRKTSPRLA